MCAKGSYFNENNTLIARSLDKPCAHSRFDPKIMLFKKTSCFPNDWKNGTRSSKSNRKDN
jgi:hypothetical protein